MLLVRPCLSLESRCSGRDTLSKRTGMQCKSRILKSMIKKRKRIALLVDLWKTDNMNTYDKLLAYGTFSAREERHHHQLLCQKEKINLLQEECSKANTSEEASCISLRTTSVLGDLARSCWCIPVIPCCTSGSWCSIASCDSAPGLWCTICA